MISLYIMQSNKGRINLYTDDVICSVNAYLRLHRYGITFILTQE
jgi:hypothetical protein